MTMQSVGNWRGLQKMPCLALSSAFSRGAGARTATGGSTSNGKRCPTDGRANRLCRIAFDHNFMMNGAVIMQL